MRSENLFHLFLHLVSNSFQRTYSQHKVLSAEKQWNRVPRESTASGTGLCSVGMGQLWVRRSQYCHGTLGAASRTPDGTSALLVEGIVEEVGVAYLTFLGQMDNTYPIFMK